MAPIVRPSGIRCVWRRDWKDGVRRRWLSSSSPTAIDRNERHSVGPKPVIDIKHIRSNPELYAKSCALRNHKDHVLTPFRIVELFENWQRLEKDTRTLRERNNELERKLGHTRQHGKDGGDASTFHGREEMLQEARTMKTRLVEVATEQERLNLQMLDLALQLPNLTSDMTPIGDEPRIVGYLNEEALKRANNSESIETFKSHTDIGAELELLDFTSSATTSGWGWYF